MHLCKHTFFACLAVRPWEMVSFSVQQVSSEAKLNLTCLQAQVSNESPAELRAIIAAADRIRAEASSKLAHV